MRISEYNYKNACKSQEDFDMAIRTAKENALESQTTKDLVKRVLQKNMKRWSGFKDLTEVSCMVQGHDITHRILRDGSYDYPKQECKRCKKIV